MPSSADDTEAAVRHLHCLQHDVVQLKHCIETSTRWYYEWPLMWVTESASRYMMARCVLCEEKNVWTTAIVDNAIRGLIQDSWYTSSACMSNSSINGICEHNEWRTCNLNTSSSFLCSTINTSACTRIHIIYTVLVDMTSRSSHHVGISAYIPLLPHVVECLDTFYRSHPPTHLSQSAETISPWSILGIFHLIVHAAAATTLGLERRVLLRLTAMIISRHRHTLCMIISQHQHSASRNSTYTWNVNSRWI